MNYQPLKFILFFAWCALQFFSTQLLAQTPLAKPVIQSATIRSGKNANLYYENDRRGNTIFSKNNGMNGPVTMIFASEYDSLNREIRSWWVHCNFGFHMDETVYEGNLKFNYSYRADSTFEKTVGRDLLNAIPSREAFIQNPAFLALKKQPRVLSTIEEQDSAGNVLTEIYLTPDGDTSAVNTHTYNDKNQEILFRYGANSTDFIWKWDIHFEYDSRGNQVLSYRISGDPELNDTTEVRHYAYNAQNKIISQDYYHHGIFQNRTIYHYDKQGQLARELFYEEDERKIKVKTLYNNDPAGLENTTIQIDYREPRKKRKEIIHESINYWPADR